ncbi:MAG: hypothetical protein ACT4OM_12610 [Actinomycetota bacterium]
MRAMFAGLTGAHAPLAEPVAALAEEARGALYRDLQDLYHDCVDDDGIMVPMTGAVVMARK